MREVADDVWVLPSFPRDSVNAWIAGDLLIDAQTRRDGERIVEAVGSRNLTAHVLTHAHPDHQGASHHVCSTLGIPFWVHELDVAPAEDPSLIRQRQPNHPIAQLMDRLFTGPGHPVDRALHDGDTIGDWRVVHTPGHSAGHVVLWRDADRVLIVGDVLNSANALLPLQRGLRLPYDFFTPDPARNRESAKRLADLGEPSVVLFGHGPPVSDGRAFQRFCASL